MVRERNLARRGVRPAADEPDVGHGVVRRAEGALRQKRRPGRQEPGDGVDLRRLERLVERERRENRGDAAREHRLAGAGRADHQKVVSAGDGDLHRALGHLLALHLGEVRRSGRRARVAEHGVEVHGGRARPAAVGARDEVRGVLQTVHRPHAEPLDDRRLVRVLGGDEQIRDARRAEADRKRQHATHRAQLAAERELAGEGGAPKVEDRSGCGGGRSAGTGATGRPAGDDRSRGDQHREGDRQVEERAVLVHVGRGEVDDDAAAKRIEAGVGESCLHAMAALANARVRKTDNDRLRISRARDVDLHVDAEGVDAGDGTGKESGEADVHAGSAGRKRTAGGKRGCAPARRAEPKGASGARSRGRGPCPRP